MLNKLQIFTEIKKVLLKSGFILQGQIVTPASRLYEDFGMDSFDFTDFFMSIEKMFDISIPDIDAENTSTIADVCACVQKGLMKKQEKQKEQQKNTNKVKNTLFKRIFTKAR